MRYAELRSDMQKFRIKNWNDNIMESLFEKHTRLFKDIAENGKSLMTPFAGDQLADAACSLTKLSSLGTVMDDKTSVAHLLAEAVRPSGSALHEAKLITEGGTNMAKGLLGGIAPLLHNQ